MFVTVTNPMEAGSHLLHRRHQNQELLPRQLTMWSSYLPPRRRHISHFDYQNCHISNQKALIVS